MGYSQLRSKFWNSIIEQNTQVISVTGGSSETVYIQADSNETWLIFLDVTFKGSLADANDDNELEVKTYGATSQSVVTKRYAKSHSPSVSVIAIITDTNKIQITAKNNGSNTGSLHVCYSGFKVD